MIHKLLRAITLVLYILSLVLGAALCVEVQVGLRGVDRTAVNNEEERPVVDDISSSTSGRFLNLMNVEEALGDEDDTRYVVKVSQLIVIPKRYYFTLETSFSRD